MEKRSLSSYLGELVDPRRSVGLRTSLDQLLIMTILGYLCGYTGYRPLARFCRAHQSSLIELLSLRHGVPSHVTFRHVLSNLDEAALIRCFNQWASAGLKQHPSPWISADGKTMNSTVTDPHGHGQNFQAVVSLFGQESGLVYALEEYHNKGKEKAETDLVRMLLEHIKGMGLTLTVDALHTQKKRLG